MDLIRYLLGFLNVGPRSSKYIVPEVSGHSSFPFTSMSYTMSLGGMSLYSPEGIKTHNNCLVILSQDQMTRKTPVLTGSPHAKCVLTCNCVLVSHMTNAC